MRDGEGPGDYQMKISGRRKKLENPGKGSECITGWEMNNT